VTTETDTPTVFQVELAEAAEVGATVGVGEGVAVGFQEVMSDAVRRTVDRTVEVLDRVGKTTAGLVEEDEAKV
jgi:hypothetical protein